MNQLINRLVVTATKALTDAKDQLQSAEQRELLASRHIRSLSPTRSRKSIFELAKAKQADASDKKHWGKKEII